ncbi:P-loop containing nucleoside triphosphate hydrolase protein [Sparassis latifolia]
MALTPRRYPSKTPVSQKFTPPPGGTHARQPLTNNDLKQLAERMHQQFKWDNNPRPFQLADIQAQLEGIDTIIQAPTGSEKTALAAGPHVWPGNEGKVTIMVSPLMALEDEMVQTFQDDFSLAALAIHSKNGSCSPQVVQKILSHQFQIIIVSPEMLQSRTFINRVLRNQAFVRQGADFRKKYSSIGIVCTFLPRDTPVIAVIATLTAKVRPDIHSKLHFPKTGSQFINVGNDRPNVSLVVRACEHPMNSFADLDFIIPGVVHTATDVPKTYLYCDNINTGTEIMDYLTTRLRACHHEDPLSPGSIDVGIICPYNATMSNGYSGAIRILVCTDAAGMGCNITTLSNFIQCDGRAARGLNRVGLAVLLVEPSAYGIELIQEQCHNTSTKYIKASWKGRANQSPYARKSRSAAQQTKQYAQAHSVHCGGLKHTDAIPTGVQPHLDLDAADEGLLCFIQSTSCHHRVWAAVYKSHISDLKAPCCDICDPSLLQRTRSGTLWMATKVKMPKHGLPDERTRSRLEDWRDEVFMCDHTFSRAGPKGILDNPTVMLLSSIGPISPARLKTLLEST